MADDSGWTPLRRPSTPAVPVAATPFARLAITHGLAAAGDAFVTVALAGSLFFDISPGAARGRVALSLLLTIAPFAVVAPFLGPALDRHRGGGRLMVFGAASGRALTCLALAAALDELLLFPLAFVALVLSKAHGVAKSALVPAAVPSDELLVEANAKLALVAVVSGFVAAVPAVALLQLAGGAWSLRVGAIVFVAAAASSLRIATSSTARSPGARAGTGEGEGAGPAGLAHEPHLVTAAVAMAVLRGISGFVAFFLAFAFRRTGAASWWFGAALAASMLGSLAGAALAPPLRTRVREERIIAAALVLVAVVGLLAARSAGRPAGVALASVVGFAASVGKLAFDALVQRDGHESGRGRSFARFEAGFQLTWVAGALLPVLIVLPARVGFFAVSLAAGLGALVFISERWSHPATSPTKEALDG